MKYLKLMVLLAVTIFAFGSADAQQISLRVGVGPYYHHGHHYHHRAAYWRHHHRYYRYY
jgi:hypothetical protein